MRIDRAQIGAPWGTNQGALGTRVVDQLITKEGLIMLQSCFERELSRDLVHYFGKAKWVFCPVTTYFKMGRSNSAQRATGAVFYGTEAIV